MPAPEKIRSDFREELDVLAAAQMSVGYEESQETKNGCGWLAVVFCGGLILASVAISERENSFIPLVSALGFTGFSGLFWSLLFYYEKVQDSKSTFLSSRFQEDFLKPFLKRYFPQFRQKKRTLLAEDILQNAFLRRMLGAKASVEPEYFAFLDCQGISSLILRLGKKFDGLIFWTTLSQEIEGCTILRQKKAALKTEIAKQLTAINLQDAMEKGAHLTDWECHSSKSTHAFRTLSNPVLLDLMQLESLPSQSFIICTRTRFYLVLPLKETSFLPSTEVGLQNKNLKALNDACELIEEISHILSKGN